MNRAIFGGREMFICSVGIRDFFQLNAVDEKLLSEFERMNSSVKFAEIRFE